jgi:glycerate 2-kinase
VRVLIAPGAFVDKPITDDPTGSGLTAGLTAGQAAEAIASGWAERCPRDELVACPQSDGGPGFVDVVAAARGGDLLPVTVAGPRGEPVPATLVVVDDPDGVRTVYLDAAQACGRQLLDLPDAMHSSSRGVGELIREALATGARRIVLGIGAGAGAVASHDGGAGLLGALGAGDLRYLLGGAQALIDLPSDALGGLPAVREGFRGIDLVAATASGLPLTGLHGASAADAVGRGASAAQAQQLEAVLGRYADLAQRSLVAGRPLAGSGLAAVAGAGAGGGLGFALLLLGARRADAVDVALAATALGKRLAGCDLVLTGERVLDAQSLRAGVVAGVAATALRAGVPCVALAHEVRVGRREVLAAGIESAYAVADRAGGGPAAPREPAAALTARARRVARTWSH